MNPEGHKNIIYCHYIMTVFNKIIYLMMFYDILINIMKLITIETIAVLWIDFNFTVTDEILSLKYLKKSRLVSQCLVNTSGYFFSLT